MDRDYLIKLTVALYRVTELFPKEEPLKYKIREKANEILADLIIIYSNDNNFQNLQKQNCQRTVLWQIEILRAFFELAEMQKWINPKNFLILKREYDKIKDEIKTEYQLSSRLVGTKVEHQHKSAQISINQRLTERQKKILEILKNKEKIQVWELQKTFPELSKRTLRRDLENLLSKNLIKRQGKDKDICYRLVGQK